MKCNEALTKRVYYKLIYSANTFFLNGTTNVAEKHTKGVKCTTKTVLKGTADYVQHFQ